MIRIAFFDIDGTLVPFDTSGMPADTLAALSALRRAGVKLILSTGRNALASRFVMDSDLFDGAIYLNGQLCELGGAAIYENRIQGDALEAAIAGCARGDYVLGFLGRDQSVMTGENEFVRQAYAHVHMPRPALCAPEAARAFAVYQLHFYGRAGSEHDLTDAAPGLIATRWAGCFADVYSQGGGKDRGLVRVCARLGIDARESIAFGDGENDLAMLSAAGVGVAMGNASERVRAGADYVTAHARSGGIARAVEHFAGELGL